jgi:hypothetical protein
MITALVCVGIMTSHGDVRLCDLIASETTASLSQDSSFGERVTSNINVIVASLSHKVWCVYYVVNEGVLSLYRLVYSCSYFYAEAV